MSQAAHVDEKSRMREGNLTDPRYQAIEMLHWGFVAAPLLAGADKFTNLLTHWENYLAPGIARLSPFAPHALRDLGLALGALALGRLSETYGPGNGQGAH